MHIYKKWWLFLGVLVALQSSRLFNDISYAGEAIYAGGGYHLYQDINAADDTYLGGFLCTWDSSFSSYYKGNIDLYFSTRTELRNNFHSAYGASGTTMDNAPGVAIIDGNVSMTIMNSNLRRACGGCYVPHSNSPMLITGKLSVRLLYCSFIDTSYMVGFSTTSAANPMCTVGSVDLLVDQTASSSNIVLSSSTNGVNQPYAVLGDIHCTIQNESTLINIYGTGGISNEPKARSGNVQGSVYIDVADSKINNIVCTGRGDIEKDFHINLQNRGRTTSLYLSRNHGYLKGNLICLVDGGEIENVCLATTNPHQKYIEITAQNGGRVKRFSQSYTISTALQQVVYFEHVVCKSLDGGRFNTINCCLPKDHGRIGLFEVVLQGTGRVDTLNVGNATFDPNTNTDKAIVTFAGGGTVNHLEFHPYNIGESVLRFTNGESAYPKNVHGMPNTTEVYQDGIVLLDNVPDAVTGKNLILNGTLKLTQPASAPVTVQVENATLAGTLLVAPDSSLRMMVSNQVVVDGGTIVFDNAKNNIGATLEPALTFGGDTLGGVQIQNPLTVQLGGLNLAPYIESQSTIPIVKTTSAAFNQPDLFAPLRKGLVWGDMEFNPSTSTWSLTNLKASPEYYGYTVGRKASSWIREHALHVLSHRSAKTLLAKHSGLWVDAHAGYEKLQALLGTAKMSWGMANMGFDYQRAISRDIMTAQGISMGVASSRTKLQDLDGIRSTIVTALINGYTGYSYRNGMYGIAGVQLAVGRVENDNQGFDVDEHWNEIVPSGSIELGYEIMINKGFYIVPRGKILVEYIPQRTLSFESFGTPETITLSKTLNVNAIGGVGINYDLSKYLPFDMIVSMDMDYIHGITGSYGAHSQIFSKEFTETNADKIFRVALGGDIYATKELCIGVHVFKDMLDTTGIGGQLTAMYTF